jgi:hypothetical protein
MGSLTNILANISAAIPSLTNNSAAAIFRKIAEALSITVDTTISELDNTKAIIDANIANKNYGKAGYYTAAALAYEDGVDMVQDPVTLEWVYSPIDTSKQTISQAAFDVDTMTLKVAYSDPVTGLLAKLPTAVLNRFTDYFNTSGLGGFAIPGITINIVSLDPNIFNASSFIITYFGSYNLVNVQADVQAALNAFRDSFQYNGVLFLNDLIEYIKANVPGIRDVNILNAEIDSVVFAGNTKLAAGYFDYDNSLSVTYVAI